MRRDSDYRRRSSSSRHSRSVDPASKYWNGWGSKSPYSVAAHVEVEQKEWRRELTYLEQLTTVSRQLEEARHHIRNLEEELERARELLAIQANLGEATRTESEPVAPVTVEEEVSREPVAGAALEKGEWEKERENLKAELEAQVALRE